MLDDVRRCLTSTDVVFRGETAPGGRPARAWPLGPPWGALRSCGGLGRRRCGSGPARSLRPPRGVPCSRGCRTSGTGRSGGRWGAGSRPPSRHAVRRKDPPPGRRRPCSGPPGPASRGRAQVPGSGRRDRRKPAAAGGETSSGASVAGRRLGAGFRGRFREWGAAVGDGRLLVLYRGRWLDDQVIGHHGSPGAAHGAGEGATGRPVRFRAHSSSPCAAMRFGSQALQRSGARQWQASPVRSMHSRQSVSWQPQLLQVRYGHSLG